MFESPVKKPSLAETLPDKIEQPKQEGNKEEEKTSFMEKLRKSRLGKTLFVMGGAMAVGGIIDEASAQEYKVNPDALKNRIEQLKQDRAKKIINARNEAAKKAIQECEFIDNGDGTFVCKFTADGVKINASWAERGN